MKALARMSVAPVPDTDLWVAKVKGYRSLCAGGNSETDAALKLEAHLKSYALRQLMNGSTLPVFERTEIVISPGTIACIRVSTLKRELREIIAEFDLLITRHAAALSNPS